jgi:hypothetical protein
MAGWEGWRRRARSKGWAKHVPGVGWAWTVDGAGEERGRGAV